MEGEYSQYQGSMATLEQGAVQREDASTNRVVHDVGGLMASEYHCASYGDGEVDQVWSERYGFDNPLTGSNTTSSGD